MANILIVDDSYLTHRLLELMLQRINHTVISAYNGSEALEILAKEPVDLVIADLYMPEMDGFMLLKQLRADDRYRGLSIVIVTASGQENIQKDALHLGATGFLTQPFSSWELKKVVAECLDNRSSGNAVLNSMTKADGVSA